MTAIGQQPRANTKELLHLVPVMQRSSLVCVVPRRDGSNGSGYGGDDEGENLNPLLLIIGSDMADILFMAPPYHGGHKTKPADY